MAVRAMQSTAEQVGMVFGQEKGEERAAWQWRALDWRPQGNQGEPDTSCVRAAASCGCSWEAQCLAQSRSFWV